MSMTAKSIGRSLFFSGPRVGRRLAKLANRHDNAQPFIGAFVITLPAHLLHHLARFRCGLLAVKLDEEMR
jgi:hypothetical protein